VETIHERVDGRGAAKVESAADLHAIDWLLAALGTRASGSPRARST